MNIAVGFDFRKHFKVMRIREDMNLGGDHELFSLEHAPA